MTLLSSASGGLQTAGSTKYYLAGNTNFTATLAQSDTAVTVSNYTAVTAPSTFYWIGNKVAGAATAGVDNAWAFTSATGVSNWSSTQATYTAVGVVPGSTANVVFSAVGATQESTTLGANMSINSLTFNDTVAVTIAGSPYALTLNSTGAGNTAGTSAIVVSSTANAFETISAGLILGANQTWDIAAGKKLTVSGVVSGTSSLTIENTGIVLLSGANTYSGGTTVGVGSILALGNGTALGASTGAVTVLSGGELDLAGSIQTNTNALTLNGTGISYGGAMIDSSNAAATYAGLVTLGSASSIIDNTNGLLTLSNPGTITGAFGLTLGGTGKGLIASAIGTGTGSLTKTGTGTWTLTGLNTYTGVTTINAGTLDVDGSIASGSALTVGGTSASGASGTPTLTGIGTVNGAVTLFANGSGNIAGTIAPGNPTNLTGTLTVGSITYNAGTTLSIALSSTASSELIDTGAATFNATPNLVFTGSTGATGTTGIGNYVLATIGSGSNLNATSFSSSTVPAFYRLLGTGTQLNLTHQANIGTITATPSATDIITGGSTTVGVTVSNTAPSGSSSLSAGATAGTNMTGGIASNTITAAAGTTSSSTSGLSFSGTTVGAGQTGSFTVTDPNADNSGQSGTVTVNVHGHAAPTLAGGTTLNLGLIHAGYTSPITSSNSLSLTNGAGYNVNLKATDSTADGVALTSVSGLAAGSSSSVTATLATGQGPGSFSNQTYVYGDDSTLNGASSNLGSNVITVSGGIYSGMSTWNTNGSGSWGTLTGTGTEAFGANWGANQGSPGLDPNFQGVDTATFGAVGTTPVATSTVNLNAAAPNLNSITFSSPTTSYTLAQGTGSSSITLSQGSGAPLPSINVTSNATAGTQAISAPVILGAATTLNVGTNQSLNISGAISGTGFGLTNAGSGVTILSSTAGNSYSGPTTVNSGTMYVNAGRSVNTLTSPATVTGSGSGTGSGLVTVNGGVLGGSGSIAGSGLLVNGGGTLASGGLQSTTTKAVDGSHLTINNTPVTIGSSLGTATLAFSLGSGTTGINGGTASSGYNFTNPNSNTTYLSLTGSTTMNFVGATSIKLIDLTNTTGTNGSLTFALNSPYLLAQAGSNADYLNLVINSGTDANPIYSLSQNDATVNGWVVGVYNGGTGPLTAADATPITFTQYGADGVTQLNPGAGGVYPDTVLYLNAGNLEVVPEPGTWALMLGGLALLIVIQRRRNKA